MSSLADLCIFPICVRFATTTLNRVLMSSNQLAIIQSRSERGGLCSGNIRELKGGTEGGWR